MHSRSGVRVVAAFEATKGILILLAGFGLLSLVHHDVQQFAERIVRHFHLNPASHYPHIFIQLVGNLNDSKLWMMSGFALLYASLRLIEAYGLWCARRWAEWLAVISGAIYVPIEVYELLSGVSWIKACTLILNIYILAYMTFVLKQSIHNSQPLSSNGEH